MQVGLPPHTQTRHRLIQGDCHQYWDPMIEFALAKFISSDVNLTPKRPGFLMTVVSVTERDQQQTVTGIRRVNFEIASAIRPEDDSNARGVFTY